MLRIALKNVLARKGRLLLTAMAVIASCAFLSGVFVFSDTITGSFNRLFANAFSKTDAFVRSSNVIEGDFGEETRARIPDSLISTVAAAPGVAEASGYIQGFAQISTAAGKEIGIDGPPKFGSVYTGKDSSPWSIDEGRAAATSTEVVIDKRSAKEGKIKIGDQVTMTANKGARKFTVTGLARFSGSDSAGGATTALFTLATAQEFVTAQPGVIDAIVVRGDGSLSDAALRSELQQIVPGQDVEVLTGAEITKENQDAIATGFAFFTKFLTAFAAIALLVGSFVIYNVFRITSAQRQKENALMRAIGAHKGQVIKAQFVEAAIVGLVGGVLGFGAGLALATLIIKILSATGFGPSDTALSVNPSSFVNTLIVGLIVTLICATFPAIKAGRVPPLAAMRDVSIDRSGLSKRRIVVGAVLLAAAIVGVVIGLGGNAVGLGVGVAALFAALVALGPLVVGPVTTVLRKPLQSVRGVTGEIAVRNAARSPERTALTAAALGIGLALLVGVSTLGSSLQSSIRSTFGELFTGDYAISTSDQGGGIGGLPTTLADELNKLPQVGSAVGFGGALLNVIENGKPSQKGVLVLDPVGAAQLLDIPFAAGGWDGLNASTILVSKDKAERDKLTLGDTLNLTFLDQSAATVSIGGIFDSAVFGNLIVDQALVANRGFDTFDRQILVVRAPGVSEADATAAIKAVTDKYPTGKLETRNQFIEARVNDVAGILNFIYALLGMSIFIAVLGLVLTLLLAVYERRRELGLSRAIGMTRAQVRSSIRWEAIVTAVLGAAMGSGLGLALGWIIVRTFRDEGLNTFSVSPFSIAIFAIGAVLLAVLAAWIPARKAAKADILQAIATT